MSTVRLPTHVAALAEELAGLPGAVAVVLGGSRAAGTARPDSDWDLGVYYRGSQRALDPDDLRRLGHAGSVSEVGEWGPVVNGGGWLTVEGTPVDVLYRDLDVVEGWLADAREGRFEVLVQNGYLVGAPTYVPVGELAICEPIAGDAVPRPGFPDALAAAAGERWRGRAAVALMFARLHADGEDVVGCVGMLAQAVLCAAHARLAERREWALNEKGLAGRAGLGEVQPLLGAAGGGLAEAVARVGAALGVAPLAPRP
jgi:predicted nucleotidyltransferase